MKKVEIEFQDPSTLDGWNFIEEIVGEQPSTCFATGYLVHQDKKHVRIAMACSDTGRVLEMFVLPRGCIRRMAYVKGGLK